MRRIPPISVFIPSPNRKWPFSCINYRRKKANFRVNNPSPHFVSISQPFSLPLSIPLSVSVILSLSPIDIQMATVLFLTHSAVAVCVRHMRHLNICKYYSVYKNRALCIHLASRRNRHNRSSIQTHPIVSVWVSDCTLAPLHMQHKIRVYATQFIELKSECILAFGCSSRFASSILEAIPSKMGFVYHHYNYICKIHGIRSVIQLEYAASEDRILSW